MSNQETLLKVENLCQYFGFNKAVDDVSFDIKKGEVFGLVGESGCGKTTTGRSIIKLYNITSGNIMFKGVRIGAGILSYKQDIKNATEAYKEKIKTASPEQAKALKKELAALIAEKKKAIKAAQYDTKNCDKEYSCVLVKEVKEKYAPLLSAEYAKEIKEKYAALLSTVPAEEKKAYQKKYKEELRAPKKKYKNDLRKAKKTRLVTQIQMIFQDPIASLDPRMTVRDIIAEGLIIQGERDKKVIDEKVYEMLELVGLVREHATRYPHEFSGGQRQRIGVARSIIMNPELIIADEPVSALDVSVQAQVINLLNELREKFGLTILFIAHDLSVVKYFSDRIGVMYYGKMVELASSDEIFAHPLHPYTRSLLSAIPLPDPIYERNRKRIVYNPLAEHDYSVDKPSLREVAPGHFVQCNDAEFAKYQEMLKENG